MNSKTLTKETLVSEILTIVSEDNYVGKHTNGNSLVFQKESNSPQIYFQEHNNLKHSETGEIIMILTIIDTNNNEYGFNSNEVAHIFGHVNLQCIKKVIEKINKKLFDEKIEDSVNKRIEQISNLF